MANTSLKRIRTFIEMYDMEQDVQVERLEHIHHGSQYCVIHKQFGPPWRTEYLCRKLGDTAHCVNSIIFDLPMENNLTRIDTDKEGVETTTHT